MTEPRFAWTENYTDEELADIAEDDGQWWSPLHCRQAARVLARRQAARDAK